MGEQPARQRHRQTQMDSAGLRVSMVTQKQQQLLAQVRYSFHATLSALHSTGVGSAASASFMYSWCNMCSHARD